MILAIVFLLLVVGTVGFHLLSPWYYTEIASNWAAMDQTLDFTFIVTGLGFVLVNVFIVFCIVKYRRRAGSRAAYEPESAKLEFWLTTVTTIGVVAMLTPGLFIWAKVVEAPADANEVEVLAQQWSWMFRFPGKDGKLGVVDAAHVSPTNPLGVNPKDPNGQDDIIVADAVVHLPKDKATRLLLRSVDVLHNFTVPQFRVKMDFVPGTVTHIWLTPSRTGTFNLLCEELCGVGHYAMRGSVKVDEQKDFDTWLASQPTFAQTQVAPNGDAVAGAANYAVCAGCHGMQGEGNPAMHAPRLAGQEPWYLVRQLNNFKHGLRGTNDQDTWGKTMAPMAATLADDAAVRNVVAYIGGLPNTPAPATIQGDAAKAKVLFDTTCAACHGAQGQGVWTVKAPVLKGVPDWYIMQQLQNFKHGVRGRHPDDMYGLQMGLVSGNLPDDEAMKNMVAYINTL